MPGLGLKVLEFLPRRISLLNFLGSSEEPADRDQLPGDAENQFSNDQQETGG